MGKDRVGREKEKKKTKGKLGGKERKTRMNREKGEMRNEKKWAK